LLILATSPLTGHIAHAAPVAKKPAAKKAAPSAVKAAANTAARPTVAFKGKAKVITATLNLRAGPTTTARDIGDVPKGTHVTVNMRTTLQYKEDGNSKARWYHTTYKGKSGWLWGGYLHVIVAKPPRPASQTNGRATQWISGTGYSMLNGLNLRAGPTAKSKDIGDVKHGQKMKLLARTVQRYVEDHRGQYRWYEVSFGNKKGWVYGAYVRFTPPPAAGGGGGGNVAGYPGYYAPRGQRLAAGAWRRGNTNPTVGYCLQGVEEAMAASILNGKRFYINSAHEFGIYAEGNHRTMAGYGLKVVNTPPSSARSFPKGTVMIYSRGRCGFNPKWGHIETVVDHDTACSDHCRRRNDEWCGPTTIFYPTKK